VVIRATDRRRYERELVEARASATASLKGERETAEFREQFIAVLGHDLRNPLAAISAGARILQRSQSVETAGLDGVREQGPILFIRL
jgi:sigma-B regulation protein RsbU (phosphoserine phosphatase)